MSDLLKSGGREDPWRAPLGVESQSVGNWGVDEYAHNGYVLHSCPLYVVFLDISCKYMYILLPLLAAISPVPTTLVPGSTVIKHVKSR